MLPVVPCAYADAVNNSTIAAARTPAGTRSVIPPPSLNVISQRQTKTAVAGRQVDGANPTEGADEGQEKGDEPTNRGIWTPLPCGPAFWRDGGPTVGGRPVWRE